MDEVTWSVMQVTILPTYRQSVHDSVHTVAGDNLSVWARHHEYQYAASIPLEIRNYYIALDKEGPLHLDATTVTVDLNTSLEISQASVDFFGEKLVNQGTEGGSVFDEEEGVMGDDAFGGAGGAAHDV